MFLEDGAQGAFGAEPFVKIHLVHHKTFFSAGPGQRGTARCASQGTETQALLPKQQTPSRSRPQENFTQTLPRHLRHSWGKPIISHCPPALSGLICRRFPSFPAAEVGSSRARLAQNCSLPGKPPLNCLANLCLNEQTLRKSACRPRQKVTEQARSKVWHFLKEEDVAT